MDNTLAHQGLPPGDPHLGNAKCHGFAHYGHDLLEAKDVLVVEQLNPFGRHAIGAPEVAAVGDRDAQVADPAVKSVVHVPFPPCICW
jgi:hypothetical protein